MRKNLTLLFNTVIPRYNAPSYHTVFGLRIVPPSLFELYGKSKENLVNIILLEYLDELRTELIDGVILNIWTVKSNMSLVLLYTKDLPASDSRPAIKL